MRGVSEDGTVYMDGQYISHHETESRDSSLASLAGVSPVLNEIAVGANPSDRPDSPAPLPGQDCPTCKRRVKFPKTERSPQSKKKGYWVPIDDHAAHEDVLKSAAEFLGCANQPFYEFKTVTIALALLLQDESLRGYANRAWIPPTTDYPDVETGKP